MAIVQLNSCIYFITNLLITSIFQYFRYFQFEDTLDLVVFATPQMLLVLAEASFVQADVTYPGIKSFPYLMNFVTFNELTMQFQVVGRVLMTRVTREAYKQAFEELFKLTTEEYPEFDNGSNVRAWIVDFSLAQLGGLSDNLGENACEVIRGCEVHFNRNLLKIADKVCADVSSKAVFKKIGYMIPKLVKKDTVDVAFDILSGVKPLNACKFINLTEDELAVNTEKWSAAKKWAKWWRQPRVAKMFTKSFKEMTVADWDICPRTTNAVESHNKVGKTNTTILSQSLEKWYRIDKDSVYKTMAAQRGIRVGVTEEKRKRMNDNQRRHRRKKPKLSCDDDDDNDEDEIDEESAKDSKKKPKPKKGSTVTDPHIGKTCFVNTQDKDKKKYGMCRAVIVQKNDKGEYKAKYERWPKYCSWIPDIHDTRQVMFESESGCSVDEDYSNLCAFCGAKLDAV